MVSRKVSQARRGVGEGVKLWRSAWEGLEADGREETGAEVRRSVPVIFGLNVAVRGHDEVMTKFRSIFTPGIAARLRQT